MDRSLASQILASCGFDKEQVVTCSSVSGGSINACYQVRTQSGDWFVKTSPKGKYPGMYQAESKGLALLGNAGALATPQVYGLGSTDKLDWLLIQWLDASPQQDWEQFGTGLAKMHKVSAEAFGLDHANYMGSETQANTQHRDWFAFFRQRRLIPQFEKAVVAGFLPNTNTFDKVLAKLEVLLPAPTQPALIHGDLWSGNFLFAAQGPVLIDPAVAFGHPESDLAMTQLFGGFAQGFYQAYEQAAPQTAGWQTRSDIFNLYPLLIHVNIFGGGGYSNQVLHILKTHA